MARSFNGTTQYIDLSIGALTGAAWDWGTVAVVLRKGSNLAWATILCVHNGSGTDILDLEFNNGNNLYFGTDTAPGFTNFANQGSYSSLTDWMCILVTKATGNATPRAHVYTYSTNSWNHGDFGSIVSAGTRTTATTISIGRFSGATADMYNGDIAIAGLFRHWNPSDAEIEGIGLPVSVDAWLVAAQRADKAGVWLLDQGATSTNVIDLTGGGANQSGTVAPGISTNSVPLLGYDASSIIVLSAPATGISYTEQCDVVIAATTTVTDSRGMPETLVTTIAATTTESDTAAFVASSDTNIAATTALSVDALAHAEQLDVTIAATTTVTDSRGMPETLATTITATTTVADTFAGIDALATTITATTTVADALAHAETLPTTIITTTNLTDAVASTEILGTTIVCTTTVLDVPGGGFNNYNEPADTVIVATTAVIDVLGMTEPLATTIAATTTVTDTRAQAETLASTVAVTTTVVDALAVTETLSTTINDTTTVVDARAMSELVSSILSATTTVSDAAAYANLLATVISTITGVDDVYVTIIVDNNPVTATVRSLRAKSTSRSNVRATARETSSRSLAGRSRATGRE